LKKAEHDAQTWEGLLSATGGELELSKCFYYVLSWKWDKHGSPVPQSIAEQHLPPMIVKMTNDNTSTEVKQKEVTHSHKTLGTYKCIVGKEKDQFEILLNKSTSIVKKISRAQLSKHQAWLAYSCCYIPSMVYSLTAVSLDEKQLTIIQKQAISKFTQLCGFEITFLKAVVHGPLCYGGLGFPHLYVESNAAEIETIICHVNKENTLGKSLCMNINWLQLHSGIGIPVFESSTNIDYIQDTWFQEIKNFLNICNAGLKINGLWQPTKLRHNDSFIMDG
jgi:hypothetical protein